MKDKITVYACTQNPKTLTRKDIESFDNCVVMFIDENSKGVFKNILKEDTSQIKLHSHMTFDMKSGKKDRVIERRI